MAASSAQELSFINDSTFYDRAALPMILLIWPFNACVGIVFRLIDTSPKRFNLMPLSVSSYSNH